MLKNIKKTKPVQFALSRFRHLLAEALPLWGGDHLSGPGSMHLLFNWLTGGF